MKQVACGQRLALKDLGIDDTMTVDVTLPIPGVDTDFALFGLDAASQLSDDRYMIFYNQPTSPCGGVRLVSPGSSPVRFEIALSRIPSTINRLTVTAAIDGAATMGQTTGGVLRLLHAGTSALEFPMRPSELSNERALMIADIYRKDDSWRFSATAQGFNGGLAALIRHYGGEVSEDSLPSTPTAPAPSRSASQTASPSRVLLEKKIEKKAPQLVSLAKKAQVVLEKRGLLDTVARVGLVLDASGSMYYQYESGRVQEVVERILPLAVHFDDDGSLDTWAFAKQSRELTPVTLSNVDGYIDREWKGWRQWMDKLEASYNYEPAVMRDVIGKYSGGFLRRSTLPAYVIFISDGGVGSDHEIEKLLVYSSKKPIFWQFVGIGGSGYGILERFDTMPGRKVDNCNFFALDDLRQIDEKMLYDRLLGEFPNWIVAARAAGILP